MKKTHILIVDDESMIVDALSSYFAAAGYAVSTAEDGRSALEQFDAERPDLVILDLMLPVVAGEEVCRAVRRKSDVPIIMLTAKTSEEEIVGGLSLGADDYVTKPFRIRELGARVEALLRRSAGTPSRVIRRGGFAVDADAMTVALGGKNVPLTAVEWKIFHALISHPHKIFTRDELIALTFDKSYEGTDRAVDTHIKNIRKKLGARCIATVYGLGYRFGDDDD